MNYEIQFADIFDEITTFSLLLYMCLGAIIAGLLFDIVKLGWKNLRSGKNQDTKTEKLDKEIPKGEDVVQNNFHVGDEMTISRSEFLKLQTELKNLNRIVQNAIEKLGEQLDR